MADTYKRVNWEDSPSIQTPISARNLNIMDKGIEEAHVKVVKIEANKIDKPSSGKVGQVLVVESVDGNGKPTSFKLVDMEESGNSSGNGVTVAQASSLWAILQKTALTEQLTQSELSAFKTAWGITDDGSGDNSGDISGDSGNTGGTDEGGTGGDSGSDSGGTGSGDDTGTDDGNDNGTEMGESNSCTVALWLSGVPATSVGVEFSDDVEVVDGEVALKETVYEETFYTKGNVESAGKVNYYSSLLGKYVKAYNGSIYYIDPEATHTHSQSSTGMVSESISYSPAYKVTVKETNNDENTVTVIPELYEPLEDYGMGSVTTETHPYICIVVWDSEYSTWMNEYFAKSVTVEEGKITLTNVEYFECDEMEAPLTKEEVISAANNSEYRLSVATPEVIIIPQTESSTISGIYTNFEHDIVGTVVTLRLDQ